MERKLKALSLVFAVMAMTAISASSAQAWFTTANSHTHYHGSQVGNHAWTAGEGFGAITCTTATFAGTQVGTSVESMTITPTFANCKDSFGRTVDIASNSLLYHYTTDGTVHVTGTMTTNVTSGGATVCTVHIGAQTNTGVGYHNLSGTEPSNGTAGITVTTDTHNTHNVTSGGFFNCGIANGTHTAGTYQGHTTLTGHDTAGNPVGISSHGPTEP